MNLSPELVIVSGDKSTLIHLILRPVFGEDYKHITKDYNEAFKWFTKAAEKGDPNAQHNLGLMYAHGHDVPQNGNEAVKWYTKAAEQGDTHSQYNLGRMYVTGELIPQDYSEAIKWWEKAAELGATEAQFGLGIIYDNGEGFPKDYKETFKWYLMAAERGYAPVQLNVGEMQHKGEGVDKNYIEAYKWVLLAGTDKLSDADNKNVAEIKEELSAQMTPAQIAEAEKRAKEFVAKKEKANDANSPDVK